MKTIKDFSEHLADEYGDDAALAAAFEGVRAVMRETRCCREHYFTTLQPNYAQYRVTPDADFSIAEIEDVYRHDDKAAPNVLDGSWCLLTPGHRQQRNGQYYVDDDGGRVNGVVELSDPPNKAGRLCIIYSYVVSTKQCKRIPDRVYDDHLRTVLGHALIYLSKYRNADVPASTLSAAFRDVREGQGEEMWRRITQRSSHRPIAHSGRGGFR